jgi:RNA polymerase sigma-70 factor (ECF subfamily)
VENPAETPTPVLSLGEAFKTTHWSVVLSSGHDSESVARAALEELCRCYWFPLYAYVRRHGYTREDAQDLTQSFFARFLEHGYFARAERERGRFRTFLLTSLKRFLMEEWRRANRQKRGGNQTFVPFDAQAAEDRYSAEPRDELSPDLLYDLRWAGVLLERVVARLRKDYESTGRTAVYTKLQGFLWGRQAETSYAEMSEQLGMNAGAVKVAVHRLRQRFRDLLREEVANTVATQEQIDDELRHLLSAFGG